MAAKRKDNLPLRIGTAGWTVPAEFRGTETVEHQLIEYARQLSCVEINSSFYKLHKPATYERWAKLVPESFRFSLKIPKSITHEQPFADPTLIEPFLEGALNLGQRLGALLLQTPGKLLFAPKKVSRFLARLRKKYAGPLVAEPRNPTWFDDTAVSILDEYDVSIARADPPPKEAKIPDSQRLEYFRLHGSPRMYYSAYQKDFLENLAEDLMKRKSETWVVFDNTAYNQAFPNAAYLRERIAG